jgi:hypothetical protein
MLMEENGWGQGGAGLFPLKAKFLVVVRAGAGDHHRKSFRIARAAWWDISYECAEIMYRDTRCKPRAIKHKLGIHTRPPRTPDKQTESALKTHALRAGTLYRPRIGGAGKYAVHFRCKIRHWAPASSFSIHYHVTIVEIHCAG